MAAEHTVALAPEHAFEIGGFAVTNTLTANVVVTLLILVFALLVRRKAGVVPSRMQLVFEGIFGFFYDKLEEGLGAEKARKLAPLVVTLFLIILISNQFILLPLVGSVVGEHGVFFRTPTTDYSMTIALALLVMGTAHILALVVSPLGHIGNYIRVAGFWAVLKGERSWKEIPMLGIEFFLGLLEIVGDLAKVISLATRLFGNIFSGEVVIIIVMSLMFATQFLIPVPFILLATFAGTVQALVFALLASLFISNNIIHAAHAAHAESAPSH